MSSAYFDIHGLLRHALRELEPGGTLLVAACASEAAWAEAVCADLD